MNYCPHCGEALSPAERTGLRKHICDHTRTRTATATSSYTPDTANIGDVIMNTYVSVTSSTPTSSSCDTSSSYDSSSSSCDSSSSSD